MRPSMAALDMSTGGLGISPLIQPERFEIRKILVPTSQTLHPSQPLPRNHADSTTVPVQGQASLPYGCEWRADHDQVDCQRFLSLEL